MRKFRHEVTRKLILESSGMGTDRGPIMQSATQCTTAVHILLWSAFTMTLATWSRRTNTRAILQSR